MQDTEAPTPAEAGDGSRMLGGFIRAQRQMANLSLRQLSVLAKVSNPYLSQVERGLHDPSVRVLKAIGEALNVSTETLLEQAGLLSPARNPDDSATERALRADRWLTETQLLTMLDLYRNYVGDTGAQSGPQPPARD